MPVSGSISTSATCAPLGNAAATLILVVVSSGWLPPPLTCLRASSWNPIARSVPGTRYWPFSNTISVPATSSSLAASAMPFCTTSLAPVNSALPCASSEREPNEPVPTSGGLSGSLERSATLSCVTPKMSATRSTNTVSWPWPDAPASVNSCGTPSLSKRIAISSWPTPPDGSMKVAQPMPRSLPRFLDSRRRLAKPFQSASFSTSASSAGGSPLS